VTYPAAGADVRLPLHWSSTPPGSTAILITQTVARASWGADGLIPGDDVLRVIAAPVRDQHWGETRSAGFTVAP
jgi:hypothetical protein